MLLLVLLRRSVNFWPKFFLACRVHCERCGIRAQKGCEQAQWV